MNTMGMTEPAQRGSKLVWVLLSVGVLLGGLLFFLGPATEPALNPQTQDPGLVPTPKAESARVRSAVPRPVAPEAANQAEPAEPEADVFRAAILREETENASIFDAQRVLNSSLGETLMDCLGFEEGGAWRDLLNESPIDIARDLDRIAVMDDAVVVSGQFQALAAVMALAPGVARVGEHGLANDGGKLVLWRGELGIFSPADPGLGRRIVDRLEGRAASGTPVFSAEQAQADIYGSWDADALVAELTGRGGEVTELAKTARRVAFRASIEQQLAQTVSIELDDAAHAPQVADKLRELINAVQSDEGPRAPPDRGINDMLRGFEVSSVDGRLEVDMPVPIDFIKRRFRACSFGVRGEAPPGYQAKQAHRDEHWSLPVPPGFVSAEDNQAQLLEDWPSYHELLELMDDLPGQELGYVDPLSLQTMQVTHTAAAGACERHEAMRRMLQAQPTPGTTDIFADIQVGQRTWTRQTTISGGTQNVYYAFCKDDEVWGMSVSIPKVLPLNTGYLRAEAMLAKAAIK